MKALCCILNYNKNENADYLYNEFNKYCEACVLDSNSDNPYPYFQNVGNFYYTNLYNKALEKFKIGDYANLIIITSDVEMSEDAIKYASDFANSDMGDIGIWGLQTDRTSRAFYNSYDKIETTGKTYECKFVEGFFNVIHKDVANNHIEIPLSVNRYGVSIDIYSSTIAWKLGKKMMIDTSFLIHHPDECGYDQVKAHEYHKMFKKWIEKTLNVTLVE